MAIRQNFRGVKANGSAMGGKFPLIPEGEYLVVVKKVEEVTSSGGNPMVKTRYMILDNEQFNGQLLFDQVVFCEKMAGRNKHILKVLEQPFEEGKGEEAQLIIEPDDWIGKQMRVVVFHDEYPQGSGTMRPKVSQYLYKDAESEAAAHPAGKNPPKKKTELAPAAAEKKEKPAAASDEEFPEGAEGEEIPF